MHAADLFTRVRDDLNATAANQKWQDAQVYRYLNRAYRKVYGEQITMFEAWGLKRGTISVVAGTELYDLPTDLKKIALVEYLYNGVYYPIHAIDLHDTYQYLSQTDPFLNNPENRRYYELDKQIGIVPKPTSPVTAAIRVTYYPMAGEIHSGVVAAAGATTVTLASTGNTGAASADDDRYNGQNMAIISGTGAGQVAQITDYVGATKVATVTFVTPPNTTSVYAIFPRTERELDELIILQADRDLCLVHDPGSAKMFAEAYQIERRRRVDEMEERNLEPRMIRYIDPDA